MIAEVVPLLGRCKEAVGSVLLQLAVARDGRMRETESAGTSTARRQKGHGLWSLHANVEGSVTGGWRVY